MKKLLFLLLLLLPFVGVGQKIEMSGVNAAVPDNGSIHIYQEFVSGSFLVDDLVIYGENYPLPIATQVMNGAKITLPTGEVEIQFRQNKVFSYGINQVACITVVSSAAGVQVGSGEAITVDNYAYPADSRIIISFVNGISNIRLKGTSGDIVAITY